MGSKTDCMKEKLALNRSYDINDGYCKHDNSNDNKCFMNRSQTRHISVRLVEPFCHVVFFHYTSAVWTINSFVDKLFYLVYRVCENKIRFTVVLIFTMNEFNCLFCENYNHRNIEANSHISVYFHPCVLTSLLSPTLFYFFIKNKAMIAQHLVSCLVWNRNDHSEWMILLRESNLNSTNNRNDNRNGTNIVPRDASTTGGMESDTNGTNNNPINLIQHNNDRIRVIIAPAGNSEKIKQFAFKTSRGATIVGFNVAEIFSPFESYIFDVGEAPDLHPEISKKLIARNRGQSSLNLKHHRRSLSPAKRIQFEVGTFNAMRTQSLEFASERQRQAGEMRINYVKNYFFWCE